MTEITEIHLKDLANNVLSQINKVGLPPGKNQIVINNIAVQLGLNEPNPVFYDAVLEEIYRVGGLKAFVNRIYEYAIDHYGNVNKASHALNIDNKSMYARMKQIRKEAGGEKANFNSGNSVDDGSTGAIDGVGA